MFEKINEQGPNRLMMSTRTTPLNKENNNMFEGEMKEA